MKSLLISLSIAILATTTISQTTYIWNGSVNSSFSTAGNWTPFRQIMYATDILIINKGGNVNITNVNQITVGQLIINNNTQLTMTPNAGNDRVLSIQGCDGDDFVIESGSSLTIIGNDPKLSVYVKTGANAVIYGNMTLSGSLANYITSQDPLAIVFKNGSVFNQSSTGNAFSNTGTENSVVFESGSTFILNNIYASSPFGLTAPASKVIFQKGSNFVMAASSQYLQFSGRTLSNITVQNNSNILINDSTTESFSVDSINVPASSSLRFSNSSTSFIPEININGNLSINGSLIFGASVNSPYTVKFTGTSAKYISGNGSINFPGTGKLIISNDIELFRDLTIACSVNHLNGNINCNGFNITVNGRFNNLLLLNPGNKTVTSKSQLNSSGPSSFSLSQNYPNPFNSQTVIEFSIPADAKVTMNMYDVTGKLISEIVNKDMNAGQHKINFDSKSISSGVYFYTVNAAGFSKTLKMIVVK